MEGTVRRSIAAVLLALATLAAAAYMSTTDDASAKTRHDTLRSVR